MPVGLTYHVCQIYLEELNKAIGIEAEDESEHHSPAPLLTLLAPLFTLAARAPITRTYDRVQEDAFVPLLDTLKPSEEEDGPRSRKRPRLEAGVSSAPLAHLVANACANDPKDGPQKSAVLLKALLDQIMNKAGEDGTRDASRRRMYALYKKYADDVDSD